MYHVKKLSTRPFFGLLTAWLIATSAIAYFAMSLGHVHLYAENGLMENLQVVLLCTAFVGFVHAAISTDYANETLPSFMALLAFAFVFRELDVEQFNVSESVIFLFAGDGRALYLVPLIGLLLRLVFHCRHYIQYAGYYLDKRSIKYIILAALCYAVFSEVFDKKYVPIEHSDFWEESFELAAAMLLCATSFGVLTADLNLVAEEIARDRAVFDINNVST